MLLNNFFYNVKPLVPRKAQILLRRYMSKHKRKRFQHIWPIDPSAGRPPENWTGWPENKRFALVLSHDVDTQRGHDAVPLLMDLEQELGFKSAYNIVPERYRVSLEMIETIKGRGFELNIHGLKHDGKLFKSRVIFKQRAIRINEYLEQWGGTGFTAPSMICNLDWIHDLNIDHSTCTFDTDPFEPQPSPSKTIFPFVVHSETSDSSYVELPYTLPQDHALFIILQETDISIWKQKLKWIADHGGMALINTHPDYMKFDDDKPGNECYPKAYYIDFLRHVASEYEGQFWNALPGEVASFWRSRDEAEKEATQMVGDTYPTEN